MRDLLDQLLDQRIDHSLAASHLADLSTRELAEVFYEHCAARNLQISTVEFYRRCLDYLVEAAGDRFPSSFTTDHLQLLLTYYRQSRHWSIGTVNHTFTAWKVFFNFLLAKQVISENPMAAIDKARGPEYLPVPYSDDELRRMLAVPDETLYGLRTRAMLLILIDTGIRLGELMGMRMEGVSLQGSRLRVFGKGRKERIVPMSTTVVQALSDYLQAREPIARTDAVWVTNKGQPQSEGGFVAQFHRIARVAGVQKAHIHRFRHSFATSYLRNGGSPLHLQRLLGHTTAVMTQRYTHLTDIDAIADHMKASPIMHLFKQ